MNTKQSGNKRVSVVIPVYNGEKYIGETVRSVLDQTYQNFDILCIIDGTKDRSKEILLGLNDGRITVLEQENSGATKTRNRGYGLTTGEYVLFLDQDDTIHPDFLEATIAEMSRTRSTAVAVNGHLIDSNGDTIRRMYRINKPKPTLKKFLLGNQLSTSSQVLIKREALQAIGSWDEDAGLADDWDLWIRHTGQGKMVFLDRYLVKYRIHDSNLSRNVRKTLLSELGVVDRTLTALPNVDAIRSYSYMRYSLRAADWNALGEALKLKRSHMLTPRFYYAVFSIAWNRRKQRAEAGGAS